MVEDSKGPAATRLQLRHVHRASAEAAGACGGGGLGEDAGDDVAEELLRRRCPEVWLRQAESQSKTGFPFQTEMIDLVSSSNV